MIQGFEMTEISQLIENGSIEEIQDGNHGEKHPKSNDFVEDGIPFIMANNIVNHRIDIKGANKISREFADKLRVGHSKVGDVLISHKGTIGNTAIVDQADPFIMLTPQVTYYRTNPKKLLSTYLLYSFEEPFFQKTMKSTAQQQGTRPYIGITAQKRLKIKMRDLAEQSAIVERLKPYDDLIQNNLRRMALLEQTARLLYQEWFTRLSFPGHELVKTNEGLPEGWELKTLGSLCKDIRESVLPANLEPDTPYIGLEDIPRHSISLSEWERAETVTSSKFRYKIGDILFGKIRPYFHKVGITFTDGITSSDTIVIRPNTKALYSLVLMAVSSGKFVAEASQTMREGSKMPRADWKIMKSYPVAIPPQGLLGTFSDIITNITDQLRTLCFQNRKLQQARDILLPLLMSGDIIL